jgi:hypothetical protein
VSRGGAGQVSRIGVGVGFSEQGWCRSGEQVQCGGWFQ